MPPARIVAIYAADGGLVGEVRYVVGKLLGRTSCSLCDISHGHRVSAKPAWTDLAGNLEVRHRNEAADVPWASLGRLPMVVAEEGGSWRTLLDADALDACEGDVERFAERLQAALA